MGGFHEVFTRTRLAHVLLDLDAADVCCPS
jgi:hypothetical protein